MAGNKNWATVAMVLLVVGGLNWGLVGVGGFAGGTANWNVVHAILGSWLWLENLVYVLVGVSALWKLFTWNK